MIGYEHMELENNNDEKMIEIKSILDNLSAIVQDNLVEKPVVAKSSDLQNFRKLSSHYTDLVNIMTDNEQKNYNLVSELTNDNYGVWTEEEKVFLDKTMLKNLFSDEGWIYTIVDLIASKICNQPLRVYKRTINENGERIVEEAPEHPLNKVIQEPNPMQDYFDWMYCIVVDLTLCGDAYLFKGFGTDSIYHLPSESMAIDINANGELVGFDRYTTSHEAIRKFLRKFTVDEIIHIRRPNPSSFFMGFSPFLPGRKNVLFNRYSLEYLNNFYLKGASSGTILEMSNETNVANSLRLLKTWEAAYLGRKNQRRTKILPPGVSAKNFGDTLADQQLKDYLAMNKEDILALLKVPKHEVGLQTSGSLGSEEYKTAIKNFWEATLKPSMGLISGKLTKRLADRLGEGYFLNFDLSGVEALKDNEIQKGQVATGMLQTHTVNEVRDILYKLGPIDGGDIIPSLQPQQPAWGLSEKPQQIGEPSIIEEEPKRLEESPKPEIQYFTAQADSLIKASGNWFEDRKKKIEQMTEKPIAEVTNLFLTLFADQAIEVIKNLDKIVKKSIGINDEERVKKVIDDSVREVASSLKSKLWTMQREKIDEYIASTFDHPSYQNDQKLLDKIRKNSIKETEKFVKERTDYVFEKTNRTTADAIYRTIIQSAKTSDNINQLAQKITEFYSNKDKMLWRGDRIARTEVLTVLSKAQNVAAKEAQKLIPDIKKMWISTLDNRTRGNPSGLYKDSKADHWELHGQVKNHDEDFIDPRNNDALGFPRDPKGRAESVINCRCTYIILPAKEMDKFVRTEQGAQPNG